MRQTRSSRPLPAPIILTVVWMLLSQSSVSEGSAGRLHLDGGVLNLETTSGSLLVEYYDTLQRDKDLEAFRQKVSARYAQAALGRLLDSPNVEARRAAVLALGLIGTNDVNATVARALKDVDLRVRYLAENALWAIWFRADSPANNLTLETVADLISRRRFDEAIVLATELIDRAPGFAEAYNQRAIAAFFLGRYAESAEDCKRAIERNRFHTGALSGLAKCQLELDLREDALKSLRRASSLQPYNESIRQMIAAIGGAN
jgi:tetratricopeptide (TPR) repeat protein